MFLTIYGTRTAVRKTESVGCKGVKIEVGGREGREESVANKNLCREMHVAM